MAMSSGLPLPLQSGSRFGCLCIAALHRADYVVAYTHQAKTLLGRELADGIALDGVVSEIEFCDHIVLVLFIFYHYLPSVARCRIAPLWC